MCHCYTFTFEIFQFSIFIVSIDTNSYSQNVLKRDFRVVKCAIIFFIKKTKLCNINCTIDFVDAI